AAPAQPRAARSGAVTNPRQGWTETTPTPLRPRRRARRVRQGEPMPTVTTHAPGTFSWPELSTSDPNAAKKFYTTLFGWQFKDNDMGPAGVYTIFTREGKDCASVYKMNANQTQTGMPPYWGTYITVESADQAVAKAKSLGGTVLQEPFDVMDFGRMAVITDPQGATFCVWQAKKSI